MAGFFILMALGLGAAVLPDAGSAAGAAEQSAAKVERLDAAADKIIPNGSALQKLVSGFTWTEGPIWIHDAYLLFSDIPSNSIRKLTLPGTASIYLQPSGYLGKAPFGGPESGSNGLTVDVRGRLVAAGHAQRDVYRIDSLNDPAHTTILADTYEGERLNSPNDLVYKSDGALYFTDPPYGLVTQKDNDPAKELKINGVYRLAGTLEQKAGAPPQRDKLQLLVKDLPRPNGIAFSPDEKYLYVNNSEPKKLWMRYTVKPDGSITDGKVFFDATSDTRAGAPDGMKVDQKGNLYSAGPGGVWIFSPEGKHLGTLDIPERVGNVAWGGADHKTLYVAARSSLYPITLKIPEVYPKIK